ncbi:MAG: 50S ribosomal protein L4 [Candidatus Hodgkinia cicadicola]
MLKADILCTYPRYDVVANVVRWHLNKRRWYVTQTKSRADASCSHRKLFRQKGIGAARHSTKAVPQFRGGGKFCAHKQLVRTKLNKKLKRLALKSSLASKVNSGSLVVVDNVRDVDSLTTASLLVYALADAEMLIPFSLRGLKCIHWTCINALALLIHPIVVITKRASKLLISKLQSKWAGLIAN